MNMTYEEWYNKYVKGTEAEEKDKVWKDGKKPEQKQ